MAAEEIKEELAAKLSEAKAKKDLSVKEVRDLAEKNRANISDFKKLLAEASHHRKRRDEANKKVREAKAKRDEWSSKAFELKKKAVELQAKLSSLPECRPVADLKETIEALEWKLQTEATNARLENALSKQIRDLEKTVPVAEEKEQTIAELREVRAKLREELEQLRSSSGEVRSLARQSDVEHEAMRACFKKADSLSADISRAIELLEEARGKAGEDAEEFGKIRAELSVEEKKERDEIEAERRAEREKNKARVSVHAQAALERFKAGGKISTQDLLALQEAGLI